MSVRLPRSPNGGRVVIVLRVAEARLLALLSWGASGENGDIIVLSRLGSIVLSHFSSSLGCFLVPQLSPSVPLSFLSPAP